MTHLQLFAVTKEGPIALPLPSDAHTLDDLYHGLDLGVYSSLRTFEHNKFLWLDQHLARTAQSMRLLGWTYTLDEQRLRRALHAVCTAFTSAEMRVRIDVLASPARSLGTDCRLLIGLMAFTPPPERLYAEGVTVTIAQGLARHDPLIKNAAFVQEREKHLPSSAHFYEQLLVNEKGEILEGTSSNFYGIRNGTVYTAGEGVLEGITRQIILNLVQQLNIPLELQPVHISELMHLDEAAVSSSSRGLLPVVQIDDAIIGDGRSGPLCQLILAYYRDFVAREIQTAI